jgi:glycosyltransferase involved in cell wall biosynthesis
VRAFADALVTLLANRELRQRMGEAARAHVEQTFSLQRTGDAFIRAYDEVLERLAPHEGAVTASPGVRS